LDTAIIVSVIIGSVLAMVLVFSRAVRGIAWTGRKIGIFDPSNLNRDSQRYLTNTNNNNPKREFRSMRTPYEKSMEVKKADINDSLINKQVLTCDNVTVGNIHAIHNNMIDIEGLSENKRYEISTYYVRQNLYDSVLLDIRSSELKYYTPQVIGSKQK
jgi:hypothetical protein